MFIIFGVKFFWNVTGAASDIFHRSVLWCRHERGTVWLADRCCDVWTNDVYVSFEMVAADGDCDLCLTMIISSLNLLAHVVMCSYQFQIGVRTTDVDVIIADVRTINLRTFKWINCRIIFLVSWKLLNWITEAKMRLNIVEINLDLRFEVFTAVTMKNGVFWDVTPCGSCKNRRFGGT
jgi:hypothetical protein